MFEKPFVEKYRPQSFDDLVIPDRVLNKFQNGINTNMLMYGSPGTGKTSSARVLVNHFNHEYIFINASLEGRIEKIKGDIIDFCSSYSMMDNDNPIKVVILDEVERSSSQFFDAFRGTIEKFSNARFILTTNYIRKIPDAILSRFEAVNFDFEEDEKKELVNKYASRILKITKNENISIDKEAIVQLVLEKYPDMRNILNTLEGYKNEGGHIDKEKVKRFFSANKEFIELLFQNKNPVENYRTLHKYSSDVEPCLVSLGTELIEYIEKERPQDVNKIPFIIPIVHEHIDSLANSIDPLIVLLSAFYQIQNILLEIKN